ncbi:G-protein alpha subunit-domain-containing protein [Gloeopeniophorella convolvens]|nr:G-protein alpha subunit-domain-containing protein [Gloeopeniophorella convolvens]
MGNSTSSKPPRAPDKLSKEETHEWHHTVLLLGSNQSGKHRFVALARSSTYFRGSYDPSTDHLVGDHRADLRWRDFNEIFLNLNGTSMRLVDVRDQLIEDWDELARALEGTVDCVIFCASLAEYDQAVRAQAGARPSLAPGGASPPRTRLGASLAHFTALCAAPRLKAAPFILLLTARDALASKLPNAPLDTFFPGYTGGSSVRAAAKHIRRTFVRAGRKSGGSSRHPKRICSQYVLVLRIPLSPVRG